MRDFIAAKVVVTPCFRTKDLVIVTMQCPLLARPHPNTFNSTRTTVNPSISSGTVKL